MPKRIALFVLGLLLSIGAFLAYQRLTGSGFLPAKTVDDSVATTEPIDDRPKTYESRRINGDLEYILSAKNFEPAKSREGVTLPGEFLMIEPAARYYTSDGRLITVHADSGTVSVDQTATGSRSRLMPRGGRLSGNVTITFGPQEGDDGLSGTAKGGTIEVKLSKDLEFDNVQRVMTSPGEIHVRSSQIAFDGEDLTIAFNPDQQRLEYFRIERGNKILVRNVDPQSLALSDAPTDASTQPALAAGSPPVSTTAPALAAGGAATAPALAEAATRPSRIPTAYKLSFGQDVAASLGTRTLTSDRLYVLFMAAASEVNQSGKGAAGKDAAPASPATPAAAPDVTATGPAVDPLPAPKAEDLVITWTGPMEMRPTGPDDLHLTGPKDKALEAVGTLQRPVQIHDGPRVVTAGRLWLHAAEKRVEIEPGDLGYVKMSDPAKGTATCQGLSYVRDTNHLALAGPGKLEVPQSVLRRTAVASARPLVISWQRTLDLDLVDLPGPKKSNKQDAIPAIRRAILAGAVTIDDPTFQIASDTMDVLIANTLDSANPQAIEHLLATGNVSVKSFRNDKTAGPSTLSTPATGPAPQPEGMTGQRLELVTTSVAGSAPVPAKLLLDGDVAAWSYRTEKPEPGKVAKLPGKQTIYAPHVEIALAPRSKGAAPDAATIRTATAAPGDVAAGIGGVGMGDFEATHFLANGGDSVASAGQNAMPPVKVELENYAPHLITATAQSIDASPLANQATLIGSAASPAKVTFADDTLTGGRIELDQNKKLFRIPGPGEFVFTLPASKDRKQPTPMQVTWSRSMTFDSDALLASFDGNAVARMVASDTADSSTLTADRLDVRLKNQKAGGAGTGATGGADLAANLAGSGDLALDTITANGKVVASGGQMGLDNKPLTRMFLTTEQLTYNDNTHQLTIPVPGKMLLEDDRPDKAGNAKANGRGQTAFSWTGSLVYDQGHDSVELTRGVHMVHVPLTPISIGGEQADAGSRVELATEHLLAKLAAVKDVTGGTSAASPVGVGNDGNQRLESVVADHGAVLTMDGSRELRADTLTYNDDTHIATASGPDGSPAVFTEPGKELVHSTLITWEMATNKIRFKDFGGNLHLE